MIIGGEKKLMLAAGKDCTAIFQKYHAWVNMEALMSKCLLGSLSMDPVGIEEVDEELQEQVTTDESEAIQEEVAAKLDS